MIVHFSSENVEDGPYISIPKQLTDCILQHFSVKLIQPARAYVIDLRRNYHINVRNITGNNLITIKIYADRGIGIAGLTVREVSALRRTLYVIRVTLTIFLWSFYGEIRAFFSPYYFIISPVYTYEYFYCYSRSAVPERSYRATPYLNWSRITIYCANRRSSSFNLCILCAFIYEVCCVATVLTNLWYMPAFYDGIYVS